MSNQYNIRRKVPTKYSEESIYLEKIASHSYVSAVRARYNYEKNSSKKLVRKLPRSLRRKITD